MNRTRRRRNRKSRRREERGRKRMRNRTRRPNLQTGREQQPMGKSPSGMRMPRRGSRRWKMSRKRIRSVGEFLSFIQCMLDPHAGYTVGCEHCGVCWFRGEESTPSWVIRSLRGGFFSVVYYKALSLSLSSRELNIENNGVTSTCCTFYSWSSSCRVYDR